MEVPQEGFIEDGYAQEIYINDEETEYSDDYSEEAEYDAETENTALDEE